MSTGGPALPRFRELYGQGTAPFVIKGAFASAVNTAARWRVRDTCDATQVKATGGQVRVTDRIKHRTVTLKAGRSYTARKR
jgi:ferric-dicitrate binding protein FerR (iron transport regulator)